MKLKSNNNKSTIVKKEKKRKFVHLDGRKEGKRIRKKKGDIIYIFI